jgi:hypothetical protein
MVLALDLFAYIYYNRQAAGGRRQAAGGRRQLCFSNEFPLFRTSFLS